MDVMGWLQLAIYVAVLVGVTKPLGLYLERVLDPGGKTCLDPVLDRRNGSFIVWSGWIEARSRTGEAMRGHFSRSARWG
jgi:hypothetical protein